MPEIKLLKLLDFGMFVSVIGFNKPNTKRLHVPIQNCHALGLFLFSNYSFLVVTGY